MGKVKIVAISFQFDSTLNLVLSIQNLTSQETSWEILKETQPLHVIASFDQYSDMSLQPSV